MIKARKQLMNETFEIKGIWYLPEQDMEKHGVQGILKYSPQKIRLELIGTLEEKDEVFSTMGLKRTKQTIYGFSNDGEWFTLYDCITVETHISAPGFDTISYAVSRFYSGSQFISEENVEVIEDITFSFTYLDAWLDIGITERREYENSGRIEWIIDFDKAMPEKRSINIHCENISLVEEIGYRIEYPQAYFSNETTKIVINRFYRLLSTDERCFSYNDYSGTLHKIRRLLTILVGIPLHFLYIDINLGGKGNSCRAFFTQVGDINQLKKISPYNPGSILILRKDIKNRLELIFERWFSQQALLKEIVNPYINDLYLPAYQEIRFLNILRSIETYHRFYIERKEELAIDMPDNTLLEERESILSFIKNHVSTENQSFFMDRVNYEDEKSLQKRLKEVINQTPEILINRLFGKLNSKKKNSILQMLVQTRNYFTHRDNGEKYPLAINDHLILDQYIRKLNIVLQFHVLECIGVERNIIEKRLIEYTPNYAAFNFDKDK